ncbi:TPA: cell wall-binding protein Cwp29 [Clostridioides difficile]|nr:cell wall-binding protein Cwp29 [Clostridioides difficile]
MKLKKLLSLGLAVSMFAAGPISANALDTIYTIQGKDKYETAALIADEQNYTTAILINADSTMADGLSASGLAGATNAPIFLTKKNNIPNATLKRVEKAKKVYIIGGESSIDKATENLLKDKGIEAKRLQGSDRIKTSYNVAKEINSINKVNKVILTNAFKGEPDAMSAAPVAVRDKAAIVLTDGKSVPFNTTGVESYVIGGTSSMSDKLVNDTNSTRLGGVDRYDTNKKIVNKFYNGAKEFYIASGTDLVYALVASPMAKNNPIVLVDIGSNKDILKNAAKVTGIGNLSDKIMLECENTINNISLPSSNKNIICGLKIDFDSKHIIWQDKGSYLECYDDNLEYYTEKYKDPTVPINIENTSTQNLDVTKLKVYGEANSTLYMGQYAKIKMDFNSFGVLKPGEKCTIYLDIISLDPSRSMTLTFSYVGDKENYKYEQGLASRILFYNPDGEDIFEYK